jgi:hypothetical protein
MPSLTNVTFPSEDRARLKAAIKHYRFENLNQFFRVCGYSIIEHHARDEALVAPLRFEVSGPPVKVQAKK